MTAIHISPAFPSLNIGLMVDGGGGWWGRMEYTKNLAAALMELRESEGNQTQIKITAISRNILSNDAKSYLTPILIKLSFTTRKAVAG